MQFVYDAYQHLGAKVKAELLATDGLPALSWVDLWYEQPDFPELSEAIDYPAAFFDFAADTITSIGELAQDVRLVTDVYLAVNSLASTAINTTADERADGLHYLELCARLHDLLHGYTHKAVGTLDCVGFMRYSARTNLIVYRISFASELAITGASDLRRGTVPGPNPPPAPQPIFRPLS